MAKTKRTTTQDGQPIDLIPRFHLFANYAEQDVDLWGWDDHLGAHTSVQHLLNHVPKLPPATRWQIVDIVALNIVARSEESETPRH